MLLHVRLFADLLSEARKVPPLVLRRRTCRSTMQPWLLQPELLRGRRELLLPFGVGPAAGLGSQERQAGGLRRKRWEGKELGSRKPEASRDPRPCLHRSGLFEH